MRVVVTFLIILILTCFRVQAIPKLPPNYIRLLELCQPPIQVNPELALNIPAKSPFIDVPPPNC